MTSVSPTEGHSLTSASTATLPDFDFSENKPTLEQQTWMAGLIISKVETAKSLSKKYGYCRKRLNKIVDTIRRGKALRCVPGRPGIIDEESFKLCSDEVPGDSATTREELTAQLIDAYHATLKRKHPDKYNNISEHDEVPQMSRRSIQRYIKKLNPELIVTKAPESEREVPVSLIALSTTDIPPSAIIPLPEGRFLRSAAIARGPEFDFSNKKPTLEQETWMASRIMSRKETAKSMSIKYGYSRKRLNNIVARLRRNKGETLRVPGHPLMLDEESFKICSDEVSADPEMTKAELKAHLNDAYYATLQRRHPEKYNDMSDPGETPRMSARSMRRYIDKLHPEPFPDYLENFE